MNVAIIGRRGLGKSTLALHIAQDLNRNVVIFDANNQFKNATVRCTDIKQVESNLKQSANKDEAMFLAYVPTGEIESEWDRFASVLWSYGDYALIIDEAHRLQKPQYVNLWLDKFMRQAPRRERGDVDPVDVIQCFHRPVDMSGIVAALLDHVYIFRVTRYRDLEYIEREWDEQTREAVTQLRTPPEGRDIVRVDVETSTLVTLTDSKQWFTNIRKTEQQRNFPKVLTMGV